MYMFFSLFIPMQKISSYESVIPVELNALYKLSWAENSKVMCYVHYHVTGSRAF